MKAAESGDYKQALEIWLEAKDKLDEADFRIAHAFISLVTRHKIKNYYSKASELYIWGLSGSIDALEQPALQEELQYLKPLIGNKNYRAFVQQLEKRDDEVLAKIRAFWEEVDLTPLTPYNERLLEHWERVAYVREHYSKINSEELDDRGFVYLKYGKPYYDKKGQLNYISSLVSRLLREGIQTPSFSTGEEFAISTTQRMNLENRIKQYHSFPQYEIWIYRDLTDDSQNTIFMFGTRSGLSSFRKIQSVDEFIPNEAYRVAQQHNYSFASSAPAGGNNEREDVRFDASRSGASRNSKVQISPALILQLMYYHQFAALDAFFGNAYNQMMDQYVSSSNTNQTNLKGLARQFDTLYGDDLIHIQSSAPPEYSEYKSELSDLPVSWYSYRFLNENNEPYIRLYTVSRTEEAINYDILKQTNSLNTDLVGRYLMVSGYQINDEEGSRVAGSEQELAIGGLEAVEQVFNIETPQDYHSILLSHELHRADLKGNSEEVSASTAFPASLKGLSTQSIEMPEPLNREGLVLSDIIYGYSDGEEGKTMSVQQSPEEYLNFNISHDRVIPRGTELQLYYEVYNLRPSGTDQISQYRFEYSITRKGKGLFKKDVDPLLSISINNSVTGGSDKNVLVIDTSGQEEGVYELDITITDLQSGSTYERTEQFEIR